ncbi:MAG: hypothetical protein ACOYWZ_06640 [Bacillota bacterium]
MYEKELEDFAIKHNLKIHPERDFAKWAELITALGRCPCKVDRPCPCSQALEEINHHGHCLCKFFMSEEYFVKFSEQLKNKKGGKRNAKN